MIQGKPSRPASRAGTCWAAPKPARKDLCFRRAHFAAAGPRGTGENDPALILTPTRELAIQIDENLHAYGKNLPLTEAVIFGGVGQAPQVDQLKRGWTFSPPPPAACWTWPARACWTCPRWRYLCSTRGIGCWTWASSTTCGRSSASYPRRNRPCSSPRHPPPEILDLVDTLLHDPVKVAVDPVSSPVEVIRQEVCLVDRKNKTALLLEILEQEQVKNALVFTRTKHGADKVARDLTRRGVAAAAIHGNKSQTARQESLRKFKEESPGPGGHRYRCPGHRH